jgi:hypothetical protein
MNCFHFNIVATWILMVKMWSFDCVVAFLYIWIVVSLMRPIKKLVLPNSVGKFHMCHSLYF